MDAQPVLQALESQLDNVETALEAVEAGLGTVVTEAVEIANTITVNKTAAVVFVGGLSAVSAFGGYKFGFRRASLRYEALVEDARSLASRANESLDAIAAGEPVEITPDVKVVPSERPEFKGLRTGPVGPLGNRIAP